MTDTRARAAAEDRQRAKELWERIEVYAHKPWSVNDPGFAVDRIMSFVADAVAQAVKMDGWLPTAANINALPDPVRKFIHDLETLADPAGIVRENTIARDIIRALEQQAQEIARLRSDSYQHVCTKCGYITIAQSVTDEQVVQAAVAAERQWWIEREDDDFPCVTAGAPKGSCKHEGWAECLYAAAAIRAPTPAPPAGEDEG